MSFPPGIEGLAHARFGPHNRKLSNRREMRFGRKGSISVRLDDGRYYDYENQRGGHLIKPTRLSYTLPKQRVWRAKHVGQEPTRLERKNLLACGIWHNSSPLNIYDEAGQPTGPNPDADPAIRYLGGRAIELWPWPETLAFARLKHPETKEPNVPTLIVARQCPVSGLLRGVQRIYLTEDGHKYQSGTVKMSLGPIPGGRVELIPATGTKLAIAEGVESALSAHILLGIPAWACCGSFPDTFALPSQISEVVIVADHDASGGSEKRAKALRSSIRRACRVEVEVFLPDTEGQDANDVLACSHGH